MRSGRWRRLPRTGIARSRNCWLSLSPYFVTDQERMVCEFEQPYVLLSEQPLSSLQPMLGLLEEVARAGAPLLIIADEVEGEALAALVVNKLRAGLKLAPVKDSRYRWDPNWMRSAGGREYRQMRLSPSN